MSALMVPLAVVIAALIALVVGLLLVARFEEPVQRSASVVIELLRTPIRILLEAIVASSAWLWERTRRAFTQVEPIDEGEWEGNPVVGAFLYAAMVVANLYAELWLMVMTLPLLGFPAFAAAPHDAAVLTAVAALSLGIFWGGMASEAIGLTKLTPWRRRPQRDRRWLLAASVLVIAGTLTTLGAVGHYRGLVTSLKPEPIVVSAIDPFAEAAPLDQPAQAPPTAASLATSHDRAEIEAEIARLDRILPPFVGMMLLLLAGLTSVAGKWSVSHSIGYLVGASFGLLWLLLAPVKLVVRAVDEMARQLSEEVVKETSHLAHLSASALFDHFASRKDGAFEEDVTAIHQAAGVGFTNLGEEFLRRARPGDGNSNGHEPAVDPKEG